MKRSIAIFVFATTVSWAPLRPIKIKKHGGGWIFFADAHTFRERHTLVKERGLQGFCSWVLGTEDLGIWDLLPAQK